MMCSPQPCNAPQASDMYGADMAPCSAAEAVDGAALALQRVDHVECCHGFPPRMFGVGDRVTENVLQERLQDTSRLIVDQRTDPLDATAASQTTDGWLGDAIDVVSHHLSGTCCAAFANP